MLYDYVSLEAALNQRRENRLCRIEAREIRAQNRRPRPARRRNGVGQRAERLLAPRDQDKFVSVGGKLVCQRRADPRRRARDQRNWALLLRHVRAVPPLLATRCPSSIRSRDEMPSRSAARQIRLLSKSSTCPSA